MIAGALRNGTQAVTTAGTRVQLTATATPANAVHVEAKPGNTGYIYVGGPTVSSTDYATRLAPGDAFDVAIDDVSKVWIDASVSLDGVTYGYTV